MKRPQQQVLGPRDALKGLYSTPSSKPTFPTGAPQRWEPGEPPLNVFPKVTRVIPPFRPCLLISFRESDALKVKTLQRNPTPTQGQSCPLCHPHETPQGKGLVIPLLNGFWGESVSPAFLLMAPFLGHIILSTHFTEKHPAANKLVSYW